MMVGVKVNISSSLRASLFLLCLYQRCLVGQLSGDIYRSDPGVYFIDSLPKFIFKQHTLTLQTVAA